ncbi:RNA pseudouridine synthase, partial [Desulfovibrio sp. OttesenSCG-928-A18]|nr:RNA pseudouridine synthase [Desulfovibrio sp. OttesenSCG-928-A18]
MRLDAALALALPELGLRARRRLWDWCLIKVNGRPCARGYMAGPGDEVRVEAMPPCGGGVMNVEPGSGPAADEAPVPLAANAAYAAFFKPAGLHSARMAASPHASLEEALERHWSALRARHGWRAERAVLLTRLDACTSGIVLAALDEDAAVSFRTMEAAGEVRKRYLGLVRGRLHEALLLTSALGTDGGRVTRLLEREDPDPARHTLVRPLRFAPPGALAGVHEVGTVVLACIGRGARHQIRAHLAAAGHPLLGDALYGGGEGGFFLHSAELVMPGFMVRCLPSWSFLPDADRLLDAVP